MSLYELSFAKVISLSEDIAEVIVDGGVEMDEVMVDEYHACLLANFKPPFSVLINKINAYTYGFQAQKKLATLKEINAIGVVSYNRITDISTEALASVSREVEWNMKVFSNREDAFSWLLSEQSRVNQNV